MATTLLAIARGQTALQLALTGVTVREVEEPAEAEAMLRELLDSGDTEVLIVDEYFQNRFSEWFRQHLAHHAGMPLVIFCPPFDKEEADTDAYINAIVKPAVGFEIRLD